MSYSPDQIDDEEASNLINEYIRLREIKDKDAASNRKYQAHQNLCISKLKYLVTMRTKQYKSFSNYEDLTQDGMIALLSAINTYNPKRGNFFWWAHKYIGTKISRRASDHIEFKIPIKKAKLMPPIKMDMNWDSEFLPGASWEAMDSYSEVECRQEISVALQSLGDRKRKIIQLAYGFDGSAPQSIEKISKILKIPKSDTSLLIKEAREDLRKTISA